MKHKIGYLGPQGTFTEMAMLEYCNGLALEPVAFPSINEAITAAFTDQVRETVVPVENLLEGAVYTTLDLLAHEVELLIKKEIVIPVRHCLITKPGTDLTTIKFVYSHPQAIGQCMQFISRQLPDAAIYFTGSTAEGVQRVLDNSCAAAIGTKRAAELYGLQIIAEGVEDGTDNCTRFLVLGKEDHAPTGNDKTSLLIAVPDTPGSLYSMLGEFAMRGINLQKIESRPSKKVLGEYIFFIDVNGHRDDPVLQDAIESLKTKSYSVKMLGSYPCYNK